MEKQTIGVPRYRSDIEFRRQAYKICNKAIKQGLIDKDVCSVCGSSMRVESHHTDYSKPLDTILLCRKHHGMVHSIMRIGITSGFFENKKAYREYIIKKDLKIGIVRIRDLANDLKISESTIHRYRKKGMPIVSTIPLKFNKADCLDWLRLRR